MESPIQQITSSAKKYFKSSKIKIDEITQEKNDKNRGVFLIKNKKIAKGIVFSDKDELKNFIKYVPKIKRAPKILFRYKNCVITEWLEGEVLNRRDISSNDIKDIAQLQASIHKIKIKINKRVLKNRVDKWFEKYLKFAFVMSNFSKDEIERIKELYYTLYPKNSKYSIIQGDFNLDNLIKTDKGWYAMDNETIEIFLTGFDFGKPMNNFHLTKKEKREYLNSYSKVLDVSFYTKNEDFYQLIFLIRNLYSKLKNKRNPEYNYSTIRKILKKYKKDVSN